MLQDRSIDGALDSGSERIPRPARRFVSRAWRVGVRSRTPARRLLFGVGVDPGASSGGAWSDLCCYVAFGGDG
jgi:hypothetical protein